LERVPLPRGRPRRLGPEAGVAARNSVEGGGRRLEAVELLDQRAQLLHAGFDLTLLLIQEVGHGLTTHHGGFFVNAGNEPVSRARPAP
jgi:hypothetical protein